MVVTDLIRYFEAWCCNLSLLVGVGGVVGGWKEGYQVSNDQSWRPGGSGH